MEAKKPTRTPRAAEPSITVATPSRLPSADRDPARKERRNARRPRPDGHFHCEREALDDGRDARWLQFLQEYATTKTPARVGWEVSIGYLDGDAEGAAVVARGEGRRAA